MKDKVFGVLQRVGRSFMLPIAILPVAGLFLGIGGSFTNTTMLETYGLMGIMGPGTFIYAILQVLNAAGSPWAWPSVWPSRRRKWRPCRQPSPSS